MRYRSRAASVAVVLAVMVLATPVAPRLASADWPPCGRAISTAPKGQEHPAIAPDGAGGAIITWQDLRTARVNVFAEHVLASGELDIRWPVDGRALLTDSLALASADGGQTSPVIVADGAVGAIVAWQDNRSPVTGTDVFAQHVLASGAVDPAWPANGTALSAIAGQQNAIAIASDGAGGAIVTWMDTRPGASEVDLYAQHVLNSGIVDARWPVNGTAVSTAPGRQEFPAIVEDGAGGVIITWQDLRDATSGFDVYAQHVLNSGIVDPAWPLNGRAVCTAAGDQGRGTITTDGAHGAIVAWTDGRIVNTFHIFAEHVLASGAVDPAWPVNGRAISNAAVIESRPLAVPDGAGGSIVNWQGFTVHLNMYGQHVKAPGVVDPAWPAGGRALSNGVRQQTHAEIVTDGGGGAIVAWGDSIHLVAQHVLASGTFDPLYPDTGRALCTLSSEQVDPALVATGGAGAIVAWMDGRNGVVSSPDIFALQVLAAGTVDVPGPPPSETMFDRPSPNPALGLLTLRFSLARETLVRLAIYDATGRRVRGLASGAQPAGEHALAWDLRDERGHAVRAGLYFARLDAEGRSFTQRLVTLK
ncbi:MAG: T9SS type A sorting domain-containing protein [Candidatus Eisenbacteria bacterium]|uniref:T9SS type A sorting domain-containing protein n=1 Tax=Eiseniibacteriota bacterium TaxID=2212470 RepID=A0A538SHV3_UNCEI|nr:MAG: T9SS type A sorting domain-containing protein [Candidatus Eisenbacteria bacterium]